MCVCVGGGGGGGILCKILIPQYSHGTEASKATCKTPQRGCIMMRNERMFVSKFQTRLWYVSIFQNVDKSIIQLIFCFMSFHSKEILHQCKMLTATRIEC